MENATAIKNISELEEELKKLKKTFQDRERIKFSFNIRPFSGEVGESFVTFLTEYTSLSLKNGWNDEWRFDKLGEHLKGLAREVYLKIKPTTDGWKTLARKMREQFEPRIIKDVQNINNILLKQRPMETVQQFANRLEVKILWSFPDIADIKREKLSKYIFVRGLQADMRHFVMITNVFCTFTEAKQMCQKLESQRKDWDQSMVRAIENFSNATPCRWISLN